MAHAEEAGAASRLAGEESDRATRLHASGLIGDLDLLRSRAEAEKRSAVSEGMRDDLLACYPAVPADRVRVIRNGIDTSEYAPDPGTDVLERYGVDPGRPLVVFVGRVTRQKGLPVLLRAAARLDPETQLVLCAGQPDTAELAAEVTAHRHAVSFTERK